MSVLFRTEFEYKACLVGSSGVGKTSLFRRLIDKELLFSSIDGSPLTVGTICPDMGTIQKTFDGKSLKLNGEAFRIRINIWDTAGQERWMSLTKNFFREMRVAILCYDVSDIKSAVQLTRVWDTKIDQTCFKLLVGCKSDKFIHAENSQAVKYIQNYYKNDSICRHIMTSAKENSNIEYTKNELFSILYDNSVQHLCDGTKNDDETVYIEDVKSTKIQTKQSCCSS